MEGSTTYSHTLHEKIFQEDFLVPRICGPRKALGGSAGRFGMKGSSTECYRYRYICHNVKLSVHKRIGAGTLPQVPLTLGRNEMATRVHAAVDGGVRSMIK